MKIKYEAFTKNGILFLESSRENKVEVGLTGIKKVIISDSEYNLKEFFADGQEIYKELKEARARNELYEEAKMQLETCGDTNAKRIDSTHSNDSKTMGALEILEILERAKDKNGEVPMRLVRQAFKKLPSVYPERKAGRWIPVDEETALQAGYEGREVRFRMHGRLFAIRELAQ